MADGHENGECNRKAKSIYIEKEKMKLGGEKEK